MVGRAKRNGAPDGDAPVKTKNIPSNAHSLIKQMTEFDLEELLLRKMGQGTPVTENDLLHQLELKEKRHKNPMAGAAVAEEDSASEAKKPSTSAPVLEKMSASKVEELDVDFALFDKDGNGEITLDEFIAIMRRPHDGIIPDWEDAELVQLFQEMDVDGGGTVCYHEFAAQWAVDREADEAAAGGVDA